MHRNMHKIYPGMHYILQYAHIGHTVTCTYDIYGRPCFPTSSLHTDVYSMTIAPYNEMFPSQYCTLLHRKLTRDSLEQSYNHTTIMHTLKYTNALMNVYYIISRSIMTRSVREAKAHLAHARPLRQV